MAALAGSDQYEPIPLFLEPVEDVDARTRRHIFADLQTEKASITSSCTTESVFKICRADLASDHVVSTVTLRAGEMIPEVEGTRPWGPRGKGSPSVSKGPKPPIQLLQLLKNSPREVKRPIFVIYCVPPGPTQEMELMGPGGEGPSRSPPPLGFSSHGHTAHCSVRIPTRTSRYPVQLHTYTYT